MTSILYIHGTYVPPDRDEKKILFYQISDRYEGDVIQPVWGTRSTTNPRPQAGRFRYHFTFSRRLPRALRPLWNLVFSVITGLRLYYLSRRRFNIVMAYGWNTTGFAALILKWLTGAKLILEIPGVPQKGYLYASAEPSRRLRLKSEISGWLLQWLLGQCDGVKTLYPGQLDGFLPRRSPPIAVYHNLVPISLMEPVDADEKYILLAGFPWYLKGVDLLIRAFKQIAGEFPDHRLRVVGHCPDRSYFEELRAGDDRIEFHKAVPNEQLLPQMARCSVFVLPSRTEGMGRVLLEAMALRKPIVASRVDGIPHYIRDGENGLLFESENVDQLATALRRVLGKPTLARRLARRGYELVHERYSEKCFADRFDALIDAVLHGKACEKAAEKNADCETFAATAESPQCP